MPPLPLWVNHSVWNQGMRSKNTYQTVQVVCVECGACRPRTGAQKKGGRTEDELKGVRASTLKRLLRSPFSGSQDSVSYKEGTIGRGGGAAA